ncbi:MAG: formate--tetrahydrofolate ligase [Polyangiales bacterium]
MTTAAREPISKTAESLGIDSPFLRSFGPEITKVSPDFLKAQTAAKASRLVLVSAITPTPAGEGKTTSSIGLAQGLAKIGESVCLALREPSLGPAFGRKGGATGGGASQVVPAGRINLHFTGDFHAISSAHNLLAALIDNHLHFGQEPTLDARRVTWPRVMDMNDRSLRNVNVGLGGRSHGVPRETGFDITAASEVMAALCLTEGFEDMRERLGRLIVGQSPGRKSITAADLKAQGAMLALLQDALWPNLVQTTEGVPAFVHGGPFANIAHGCNSVLATRMALKVADWAITEAGFGFDLGGEKFFDIKCRSADLNPAHVVLVATVRALKYHGGTALDDLSTSDPAALRKGLPNLARHVESVQSFDKSPLVVLNRFTHDTDEEIAVLREYCDNAGIAFAASDHFTHGGDGAIEFAKTLVAQKDQPLTPVRFSYELESSVEDKVRAVSTRVYGAKDVSFTAAAKRAIRGIKKKGFANLPVCMAKTQSSLSDDPKRLGRPEDFTITIRDVQLNAGAGFLVVITGDILRMPGLPKAPRAHKIDIRDGVADGMM